MATATWTSGISSAPTVTLTVTQSSQNIASNTSTVAWNLKIVRPSSISSSASKSYSVVINGSTVKSGTTTIGGSGTKTIASGTSTITHNSDGTKSISFSFSLELEITWSGTYLDTASKSGSMTLTTIPRKSTLSANNGILGTAQTLTINRASSSFTHTITYRCGNATGTIATRTTSTSVSFTPPLSLASQNTTGTTVSIVFTITTYSGNTSLGSNTKTISASIPSTVKPSIGTITTSDPNGYFTTYGAYIKGKSRCRFVIATTAAYGSAISSYKVVFNSNTYTSTSNTINSALITTSGTLTATITVTDKRGRTASKTASITVLAYSNPVINSLSAVRCDRDGNTNVTEEELVCCKLFYKFTTTALNNNNTVTCQYEYKKTTESTYVATAIPVSSYIQESFVIFPAAPNTIDSDSSYNIRLIVTDDFDSTSTPVSLSSAMTIINWLSTGFGMAIGKVAELANHLEIKFTTMFKDDVYMDSYSDIEKNFYYINNASREGRTYAEDGIYPHDCKIYGGSGTSPIGIGLWDDANMKRILSYNDVNKFIMTGVPLYFNNSQVFEPYNLPNTNVFTINSGYAVNDGYVCKWGALVMFHIYIRNTTDTIGSGNITNIYLGTIIERYRPIYNIALGSGNTGPVVAGQMNSDGKLYLGATTASIAPSTSVATFSLSGCWISNFT